VPSHGLAPLLDVAEKELGARVRFALVDHEQSPRLAERYAILGLPTLILLSGGAEVSRRVGLPDLAAVREMVGAPGA
jgi:thioredoxin